VTELLIARRNAPSITIPTPGGPLIRSVPELGWQKVRIKATIPVDADMPKDKRKRYLFRATQQFIREEEKLRGARFAGGIELSGPRRHLDVHPPDIQVGDRGGTRPRARNMFADTQNGKEAYDIWGDFWIREQVTEVRTDVALDLFKEGRPGVRPMRARDYPWFRQ
jgi:hypothetical protein